MRFHATALPGLSGRGYRRFQRADQPGFAAGGARAAGAGDSDTQVVDYVVARYGELCCSPPRGGSSLICGWRVRQCCGGGCDCIAMSRRRAVAAEAMV